MNEMIPLDERICPSCGSDEVELLPAEYDDEPDILHCYGCGDEWEDGDD